MLRAVGMSRQQVRRLIRYEAVITALIGAILGTILGIIFATLVSRPLADEGFELSYPIGTLLDPAGAGRAGRSAGGDLAGPPGGEAGRAAGAGVRVERVLLDFPVYRPENSAKLLRAPGWGRRYEGAPRHRTAPLSAAVRRRRAGSDRRRERRRAANHSRARRVQRHHDRPTDGTVTDDGAPLTARPRLPPPALQAICTGATRVEADLGDGDDSLTLSAPLPGRPERRRGRRHPDRRRRRRPPRRRHRRRLRRRRRRRGLDRPARQRQRPGELRPRPRHGASRGARPARLRLRAGGLRPPRQRRAAAPDHRRRALRADPGPGLGARGPPHPARRALPDPPLPRAGRGRVRDHRPRAATASTRSAWPWTSTRARAAAGARSPAWPSGPSRARTTRARRSGGWVGTAMPTTATPSTAGSAAAARRTCTSPGPTRPASRATRCGACGSST